jgi:hypothetical protein
MPDITREVPTNKYCSQSMKTATSFGGPFVLLPKRLFSDWVEGIGDAPDIDSGLYGEVCNSPMGNAFAHIVPFMGGDIVRLCEMPDDLFWIPLDYGGVLAQCIAADSLEAFVEFALETATQNEWDEVIEFKVTEREFIVMDSCGFDGDDQPKIDLNLEPGMHRIESTYKEGESTYAYVFRIIKCEQASSDNS